MTRYIALLRGINVGGYRLLKMDDLRTVFERAGFKNVTTYLQSGNVIFDTAERDRSRLTGKIERTLLSSSGHEIAVVLRTPKELEDLVNSNPFKQIKPGDDVMLCVIFLSGGPAGKPKLPLISEKERLEVFAIKDRVAYLVSRRKPNGWFGFPNNFVEKELMVTATTRQWKTVQKILKLAQGAP
jgi:uncharacterized protein (DUF1697 family)